MTSRCLVCGKEHETVIICPVMGLSLEEFVAQPNEQDDTMRLSARVAWRLAGWLAHAPQTTSVIWWTAALLRFATTGKRITVTKM